MSKTMVRNCTTCLNAKWCGYIHPYRGFYCPGMEQSIDNKAPRKEELLTDVISGEDIEGRDYKDVLNEMRQGKDDEHERRHDEIMGMPDKTTSEIRIKTVAALLFFGVQSSKIMRVLRIPERSLRRLITGK